MWYLFYIAQEMSINSETCFRVTLRKMKYLFGKVQDISILDHDLPVALAPGTRTSKKISNILILQNVMCVQCNAYNIRNNSLRHKRLY